MARTVKKAISIDKEVYKIIEERTTDNYKRSTMINDLLKQQLLVPNAIITHTINDLAQLTITLNNLNRDIDNLLDIKDKEYITPDLKSQLKDFQSTLPSNLDINKLANLLLLINKYQN